MSFLQNIKKNNFWSNFLKVTIPFCIIVILISLLLSSWSSIIQGNFDKVVETNFSNGKWQSFFALKIAISILYGLYITNKNTNK